MREDLSEKQPPQMYALFYVLFLFTPSDWLRVRSCLHVDVAASI